MKLNVRFLPDVNKLIANPYWSILRNGLQAEDVVVSADNSMFGYHWLNENRASFDILHFHYIQMFYSYEHDYARLRWVIRLARNLVIARQLGYRTLFTLHNLHPTYALKPGWVDYLGHWLAANLTSAVIVHCQYARTMLAKRFGRRNHVYVVHHPHLIGIYDNHVSKKAARSQLGLRRQDKVFLFFGGIRPNKGVTQLIKAFKELPGRDLRLIIAGKPWPPQSYQAEVRRLAASDKRIILQAQLIPDNEVQLYFNAADIVVLPFTKILTSSTTILSLSFGKPVIVPDIGCLSELINESVGFKYDPATPSALAGVLQRSWTSDLDKMSSTAEAYVKQFTWKNFAASTKTAYLGH